MGTGCGLRVAGYGVRVAGCELRIIFYKKRQAHKGAGQIFNFILKCHCTDDFSRQVARYFPATAKVVGTRQIKNLSCTRT